MSGVRSRGVPAGPARPRRRRLRRVAVVGTSGAVLLTIAVLGLRDTSPVGHFTSAAGRDAYAAAYARAMRDMPAPDATVDVRTTYGVVRLYRFDPSAGADPRSAPLLLIPGRSAASPVWAGNLPSLRALGTVYTVDLLGEPGASIQDRPITSGDDHAQWLHEVVQQIPANRVHLVGMSIGGWTAMNLALRRPGKVASVTVLDPVMTFADLSAQVIVRSIPALVPWFPRSWRDSFNSWTAGGAPVEDVPIADMLESAMKNYRIKLPTPNRITETELASVDVPVLAIIAGRSVMHDGAAAADVARRALRHGTVHVYDGSHALNGEYPDRIAADLAAFLTAHGGS